MLVGNCPCLPTNTTLLEMVIFHSLPPTRLKSTALKVCLENHNDANKNIMSTLMILVCQTNDTLFQNVHD